MEKKRWTFHNWISYSQIESTPLMVATTVQSPNSIPDDPRFVYLFVFFKYTGTTLFKLINLRFHSHFTCSWIWFQIPSTFRRHVNAMPMVRLLINKKQTTTVDFETYIILVNIEIQLAHHTSTLSRCDYFPNR